MTVFPTIPPHYPPLSLPLSSTIPTIPHYPHVQGLHKRLADSNLDPKEIDRAKQGQVSHCYRVCSISLSLSLCPPSRVQTTLRASQSVVLML